MNATTELEPLVSPNPTGTMSIMGRAGDLKSTWDRRVPAEVEQARRQFDELRAKGYTAFRVKTTGEKAEVMREFDADAEMVILAPPMAGG